MPLYMHKETFNIFGGYYITDFRNENCFEVDELIARPIQILNRKGYFTTQCCSGHPFMIPMKKVHEAINNESYIAFQEGIALPSVPRGFKKVHNGYRVLIFRLYLDKKDYECLREIFKSMELLYLWALNLPEFKSLRKKI
ncbi:MAG: hypothetical protein FWF15_05840 [Oscillospiraceae bacterium]|nr:hypothetical protein [Oscillospiraceae bacterium]